jgi:hypothetical protein
MASNVRITRYSGEWFIPNQNVKIQGTLIIDKDGYTQVLKLYTQIDFHDIQISQNWTPWTPLNYTTLLGNTEKLITLSNCDFCDSKLIGVDLYELTYNVTYSFIGGHTENPLELSVSKLTCTIPYFSSWYDTNRKYYGNSDREEGEGSYQKKIFECFDEHDYKSYNYVRELKPAIHLNELRNEINISNDLSIVVQRRYQKKHSALGKQSSINVNHYIHFVSKTNISFEELRKEAYKFLQLMKLATGKLLDLNIISLHTKQDSLKGLNNDCSNTKDDIEIWINKYDKLGKRNFSKSDYLHQNYMLFHGDYNNYTSLDRIISNWYKSYDKFFSVYNIFLDTFEWFQNTDATLSLVMFNNRILNLIQALESYHSYTHPDLVGENQDEVNNKAEAILKLIENDDDKAWILDRIEAKHVRLRQRLNKILKEDSLSLSNIIFQNGKDKESFIYKLTTIRNPLSHGESIDIEETKLHIYYYKTLLILLCCILKTLELSDEQIQKKILKNQKYNRFVHFIKSKFKRELEKS